MQAQIQLYNISKNYTTTKLAYKLNVSSAQLNISSNKMLSYRKETALQGAFVLAKSERLKLGDDI